MEGEGGKEWRGKEGRGKGWRGRRAGGKGEGSEGCRGNCPLPPFSNAKFSVQT